jgi:hypothetical protein
LREPGDELRIELESHYCNYKDSARRSIAKKSHKISNFVLINGRLSITDYLSLHERGNKLAYQALMDVGEFKGYSIGHKLGVSESVKDLMRDEGSELADLRFRLMIPKSLASWAK